MCNAGIAEDTAHTELTFENWKRTIDVNVHGPFLCTWVSFPLKNLDFLLKNLDFLLKNLDFLLKNLHL